MRRDDSSSVFLGLRASAMARLHAISVFSCFFYLLITSPCWNTCGGQTDDERSRYLDYRVQAVAIEDKDNGLDVASISSTEVESGHPPNHLTLPDRHFGPEYGNLYNLDIVNSFLFLSVENGVLVMNFTTVNGTFEAKPLFHVLDWPETERLPCQPTTVLIPSLINQFVACVNETDSDNRNIRLVGLDLDPENLTASTLNPTPIYFFEPLTTPISLTNFIPDVDAGCLHNDALNHIVFANRYIVRDYSIRNRNVNAFLINEECLHANSLEYYGGNTLLVRCPDNVAERLDLCDQNTIQLYSEDVTGIPYPCGSWDTVAYLQSGGIFIESRGLQAWPDNWTLTDVTHAECAAVDDKVFVAFSIEDRVVVMETGSDTTFHTLANTSCINSSQCFQPHIWENRLISYTNGSDYLVKDLYCLTNPAIIVLDSNPRFDKLIINEIPPSVECAIKPAVVTVSTAATAVPPTPLASPKPSPIEPPSDPETDTAAMNTTVLPTPTASPKPPVIVPPATGSLVTRNTLLSIGGGVLLVILILILIGLLWYQRRRTVTGGLKHVVCVSPTESTRTLSYDDQGTSTSGSAVNVNSSPETAPLHPETAPLHPETAPPHPETAPLHPETTPLHPEIAPLHPETAPLHPETAPPHPETTPLHPEATPLHPEIAPLHPETAPLHPETAPLHPETAPLHPETAPLHPETTPLHPEATPLHPEIAPLHPETVPLHPETASLPLETTPLHPETTPSFPVTESNQTQQQPSILQPSVTHAGARAHYRTQNVTPSQQLPSNLEQPSCSLTDGASSQEPLIDHLKRENPKSKPFSAPSPFPAVASGGLVTYCQATEETQDLRDAVPNRADAVAGRCTYIPSRIMHSDNVHRTNEEVVNNWQYKAGQQPPPR